MPRELIASIYLLVVFKVGTFGCLFGRQHRISRNDQADDSGLNLLLMGASEVTCNIIHKHLQEQRIARFVPNPHARYEGNIIYIR